jgi:acetyl esterase/lipase
MKANLIVSLLASLAVSSLSGYAQKPKAPPVYPTDVRVETDVAYLPADRKEKADLYFPMESTGKLPAVIVIHGGGFNDGDKARKRELNFCGHLARRGYVAMSINYKLRRMKGQVTWPQSVYDAKSSVRWLRKNAERLGIDPERIGVMGSSAGGNLAAMLATTGPSDGFDPAEPYGEFPATVACAVDFYGAVDLMNYHDMKMFAKTREEAPELYKKASPITYVDAGDAPLLMVHGTADETVPLSQSETLAAICKAAGMEHELIVIPDAPHTFYMEWKQHDLKPAIFGFLDKHLKKKPVTQP